MRSPEDKMKWSDPRPYPTITMNATAMHTN